jgi:hypothetical protein
MKNRLIILTLAIFSFHANGQKTICTSKKDTANEFADRIAISELINNYARFADRREAEKQANLFTDNATIEIYHSEPKNNKPDTVLIGKKAFVTGFETLEKYDVTMHFNGQSTIHIYGDSAIGEVYCLAHHLWTENGKRMLMVMGIRYYDTYVRKNDHWLFAKRRLVFDWVDKRPSTPE